MSKASILIVEDEAIVALELQNRLTALGYRVTAVVDTGEKTLAAVASDRPDIVLTDVRLKGGMDGIEAAGLIRARFDIPVVFISAFLDRERLDKAKLTMPFGYLIKPVQDRDLQVTIEMAVYIAKVDAKRKQTERELQRREAYLQASFDSSNQHYYLLDREARVLSFNRVVSEYCRQVYNRRMRVGDSIYHYVRPQGTEPFRRNLEKAFSGERVKVERHVIVGRHETWFEIVYQPVYNRQAELFAVSLTSVDITERRRNEQRLQYQAFIWERVSDAIISTDIDFNIYGWNPAAERVYGWSGPEVIGRNAIVLTELKPSEGNGREIVNHFFAQGSWEGFIRQRTKDGRELIVHTSVTLVRDDAGKPKEVISVNRDMTEARRIQEKAAYHERFYRRIFETCPDGIGLTDLDGRLCEANPALLRQLGYDRTEELLGKHFNEFTPEWWRELEMERIRQNLASGVPGLTEKEYIRRDGSVYPVMLSGWFIHDEDGNPEKMGAFVRDITDLKREEVKRKKSEAQLKASLAEKEILLKEIHHRVKNSLAVMTSLLSLQAGHSENVEVRCSLEDSRRRLQSMAMVHDSLYLLNSQAEIDIKGYLTHLIGMIGQSCGVPSSRIRLDLAIEDWSLSSWSAAPLGLIVNELLTNAIKYAFPGDREGTIAIRFKGKPRGELTVADDGIGMPEGLDWRQTGSLGLTLVRTLAEKQLDGDIQLMPGSGTTFLLRFIDKPRGGAGTDGVFPAND